MRIACRGGQKKTSGAIFVMIAFFKKGCFRFQYSRGSPNKLCMFQNLPTFNFLNSFSTFIAHSSLRRTLQKGYNLLFQAGTMSDCLFCRIVAKKLPAQMVYEDDSAVAFKDIHPQAPTHVLIVSRKHIESLAACSEEDSALLGRLQRAAAKIAAQEGLSSFRVVTNNGRGAGQSVDHLHYHLLGGRPMQWPPG
jgi:histidine triad (HIT) family protein